MQSPCTVAISGAIGLVALLGACGGSEPASADPSDEPASDEASTSVEPTGGARSDAVPPTHEAMSRALASSTAPLAELADASCSALATSPGPSTLGELVGDMPSAASEQGTECEARGDGFHCRTRFEGLDEEGSAATFDYDVDDAGAMDLQTLTCMLAG